MRSLIDIDRWTLSAGDRDLIMRKHAANRLDVALLLKFFQSAGRFPTSAAEIELAVIDAGTIVGRYYRNQVDFSKDLDLGVVTFDPPR